MSWGDFLELFPYQIIGARFLADRKCALLGDEMGLGKSAQAITACDHVKANRILVICRAVARANWAHEFDKFARHERPIQVLYQAPQSVIDKGVVISSYELLPAVLEAKNEFDVVIVDEAHYIKNPEALRTKQVLGKNGIIQRTKYFWELTGTPTPNHAAELWTHLFTFGQTQMKYNDFVDYFCHTRNNGFNRRQIVGTNRARTKELQQLLKPIFLRRTIEGAGMSEQIPKIFFQDLVVQPGQVALDMTKSFIKYAYPKDRSDILAKVIEQEYGILKAIVDKNGLSFETVKAMEAASQSVSTLRRLNGLQKIRPVLQLIDEEMAAGSYEKIVIFATHRDTVEHLYLYTRKYHSVKVYGGTNPRHIDARVKMFQTAKACRVFIGNISAAGTSINLTAANHVIIIEPDWTPGNNAQAIKRCHRIGQTKPVFVRFVSLENSIDQHISNILRRKTEEIAEILGESSNSSRQAPELEGDISSLL